jgi:catechol 2,3-dioxygenase-like lactoylglutathione lyase family enzyme
MLEGISAVTLGTHEMPRAVRFYRTLGFEILHGGEGSPFTSFRAGTSYLNLIVQPAERRWSWWGRVIFYVTDVDALYERALAVGYQPATVPRNAALLSGPKAKQECVFGIHVTCHLDFGVVLQPYARAMVG